MTRAQSRKLAGMAVLAIVAGRAESARAGGPAPAVCPPPAPSANVVYRPAYPVPRVRTFYLSNYAGSNYPTLGPRSPLAPSTLRVRSGRPFGWFRSAP